MAVARRWKVTGLDDRLVSEFRYAVRGLLRTPIFSVTAVITLALGMGAAAAMFAIVYGILFAPLPYGDPDRLVSVSMNVRTPELRQIQQPLGAYFTYKRFARRIADIGFYRSGSGNIWSADEVGEPERVQATWMTASTLPTLRVAPALGRLFTTDEDLPRSPLVVIISDAVWRSRFGASRDVIGKTLVVNSLPRTIIGVMPAHFQFPTPETRVWIPARLDMASTSVGDFTYSAVARLSPRVAPAAAQSELASLLPRIPEFYAHLESGTTTESWLEESRPVPTVVPLRNQVTGGIARTLWMLVSAAGLVLLVACANVTNLMMIRADGRQLELAVREALGAGRLRLLSQFIGQSVVLAATGGVFALLLAFLSVRALVTFGPTDIPRISELRIGPETIAFTALMGVVVTIICSTLPTFRARRAKLSVSLRDGGRGETASRSRQRVRGVIAAMQIAVAVVVVAGSTLLLRTLQRLYQEQPGFNAEHVTTLWMQLPFARYGDDSSAVRYFERLTADVSRIPGVQSVGLTNQLPLGDGERNQRSYRADGDGQILSLPTYTIDGGYLATMSIPIIAGRAFTSLDRQRGGEVVISRRAALTLWNDSTGKAAVGRRLVMVPRGPSYTVIGVAGDVRDRDLGSPPTSTVYVPQGLPIDASVEPRARRSMALVVKSNIPFGSLLTAIRQVMHDVDPTVPTYNEQAMSSVVRESTARLTFTIALMSAAAAIILVLGAVGLYGVIAYMVALRTREFGVRLALGAGPRQLVLMVVRRGLTLVAGGLAGGLLLYAVASQFLRTFLYGVTAADPLTLVGTTFVLMTIGLLASGFPAWRASRVDPAITLRAE